MSWKKNSFEGRPLGILTLRDRVLQTIWWGAIHPIAEYQVDPNSYVYRKNRGALNAISKVYKRCIASQNINTRKLIPFEITKKVHSDTCNSLKYKWKIKVRSRPGKKLIKTQRNFTYKYYTFRNISKRQIKNNSKNKFRFAKYIRIWNFEIEKCFDKINHTSIIEFTPICNKYLYLRKAWLIIGSSSLKNNTRIKIIPNSGIPQGSIIGPGICNLILDGIEDIY